MLYEGHVKGSLEKTVLFQGDGLSKSAMKNLARLERWVEAARVDLNSLETVVGVLDPANIKPENFRCFKIPRGSIKLSIEDIDRRAKRLLSNEDHELREQWSKRKAALTKELDQAFVDQAERFTEVVLGEVRRDAGFLKNRTVRGSSDPSWYKNDIDSKAYRLGVRFTPKAEIDEAYPGVRAFLSNLEGEIQKIYLETEKGLKVLNARVAERREGELDQLVKVLEEWREEPFPPLVPINLHFFRVDEHDSSLVNSNYHPERLPIFSGSQSIRDMRELFLTLRRVEGVDPEKIKQASELYDQVEPRLEEAAIGVYLSFEDRVVEGYLVWIEHFESAEQKAIRLNTLIQQLSGKMIETPHYQLMRKGITTQLGLKLEELEEQASAERAERLKAEEEGRSVELLKGIVDGRMEYLRSRFAFTVCRDLEGYVAESSRGTGAHMASVTYGGSLGGGLGMSLRMEQRMTMELRMSLLLEAYAKIELQIGVDLQGMRDRLGMVNWLTAHEAAHVVAKSFGAYEDRWTDEYGNRFEKEVGNDLGFTQLSTLREQGREAVIEGIAYKLLRNIAIAEELESGQLGPMERASYAQGSFDTVSAVLLQSLTEEIEEENPEGVAALMVRIAVIGKELSILPTSISAVWRRYHDVLSHDGVAEIPEPVKSIAVQYIRDGFEHGKNINLSRYEGHFGSGFQDGFAIVQGS